jgi:ATP-binding cassette subfamily C protein CydC
VIAAGLARLAALAGTIPVPSPPAAHLAGDQITITQSGQTLVLKRGDRLVVTGPSGCGKTSLLEAIAGQRDAACHVMIDGNLIGAIPADRRRALFALSPQNAQMIAGTIADNLGLARPGLTADDMWRALETASLADAVRAMPEGLGTWIGDGGTRLSGGERKRLSLARALLAGRPWLLLDEPSEGLDPQTECKVQANLDRWLAKTGTGLILVTHRAAILPLGLQHLAIGS